MNEDGGQTKLAAIIGTPIDQVFECCWDNCDWQFEDMTDCIDHCIAEQNGHVQASFANAAPGKNESNLKRRSKQCLCFPNSDGSMSKSNAYKIYKILAATVPGKWFKFVAKI